MTTYRFSGLCGALDWKPLVFEDPNIARKACSLCTVMSRKAVRLPCSHTLCSDCHEECARQGSTCPFDGKSFNDDCIVHLDTSETGLGKLKVACWNAPYGCNFVGPANSLLDHYTECAFHVVSCPRCQSAVLRREIVGHYKEKCKSPAGRQTVTKNPSAMSFHNCTTSTVKLEHTVASLSRDVSDLRNSLSGEVSDLRKRLSREVSDLRKSLKKCQEGIKSAPNTSDVPRGSMKIFVKAYTGKVFTLTVDPTEKIQDLKENIYYLHNFLPREHSLSIGGQQLENNRTLLDYKIKPNSMLLLREIDLHYDWDW